MDVLSGKQYKVAICTNNLVVNPSCTDSTADNYGQGGSCTYYPKLTIGFAPNFHSIFYNNIPKSNLDIPGLKSDFMPIGTLTLSAKTQTEISINSDNPVNVTITSPNVNKIEIFNTSETWSSTMNSWVNVKIGEIICTGNICNFNIPDFVVPGGAITSMIFEADTSSMQSGDTINLTATYQNQTISSVSTIGQ